MASLPEFSRLPIAGTTDAASLALTLERKKELDHAHRSRGAGVSRSGAGLALSLRFLRMAAQGLLTPTRRRVPVTVKHPAEGEIAVTFVGHATVMLTTKQTRVLTDPLFTNLLFGLRRAEAACLAAVDAADVDLILISHSHRDHLHPASLRRLPKTATIVVPSRCAGLVESIGFSRVVVLEPGESYVHRDVEVMAVAARHDGACGLVDRRWRGTLGYLVRTSCASAYFAGDTAYFSGFADLGRRIRPDLALLPISGYDPAPMRENHMSPLDAVYAFEDLGSATFVPITHGSFARGYEPLTEPLAWLAEVCAARGIGDRLVPLAHGETFLLRGRTPPNG